MKIDEDTASDRAKMIWKGSIPDGEYNRDVEVKATRDGLIIDEFTLVPWEWVLRGLVSQIDR